MEHGVCRDLIIIYPKPYSIYLGGTIVIETSFVAGLDLSILMVLALRSFSLHKARKKYTEVPRKPSEAFIRHSQTP